MTLTFKFFKLWPKPDTLTWYELEFTIAWFKTWIVINAGYRLIGDDSDRISPQYWGITLNVMHWQFGFESIQYDGFHKSFSLGPLHLVWWSGIGQNQ